MSTHSTLASLAGNPPATHASPLTRTARLLLATDAATAPLLLRFALAAALFPHGAQKLLGWFGGYGFAGTMQFFTGTMHLPALLALGVILIEFFAPLLLVAGFLTRLAALGIGVVMGSAMMMVHIQNGFFMNWSGTQKGEGIEYFILAIGIAASLLVSGGGILSVDRTLGTRSRHP